MAKRTLALALLATAALAPLLGPLADLAGRRKRFLLVVTACGGALAAAVVFDAFIVRMVLIPATLYLLGEKAWWLPKWLDRILPNVDVEGAAPHCRCTAGDANVPVSGVESGGTDTRGTTMNAPVMVDPDSRRWNEHGVSTPQ